MTVAVVTGGAGGIGAAVAWRLSCDGDRVVVVDRDAAGNAAVADELPVALAVAADVADEAAVTACMARAVEAFGRIDRVVRNGAWPALPRHSPTSPPRGSTAWSPSTCGGATVSTRRP
jgi:NAD(P)-dependent dehydrogenase (short-subunit alcohol dehydrogenase family)